MFQPKKKEMKPFRGQEVTTVLYVTRLLTLFYFFPFPLLTHLELIRFITQTFHLLSFIFSGSFSHF